MSPQSRGAFSCSIVFSLCICNLYTTGDAAGSNVRWWLTSKDTSDRLEEKSPLVLVDGSPDEGNSGPAPNSITVDLQSRFQPILGFGGGFTQSSATVFQQLSVELQNEFLEAYFGDTGIGYSTGRLPINSCDFSPTMYSFDDVTDDYDLVHFDDSVAQDAALSIPLILAALNLRPDLKLFGSPWSPPAWMKTNLNMLQGGKLKPEAGDAWSRYFVKWIAAYEASGVPIWGVTVQNEPEASMTWESCLYTAQEEADFVANHLGPTMRDSFPDVKLLGYDHNKDHIAEWADALMGAGSSAASFMDGIAFHWYSGSCFDNVAAVAASFPDKILLPSEACYELTQMSDDAAEDDWLEQGNWARGEGYGFDIMGDLNSGSSGWTDWNIILDQEGGPNRLHNYCDAPILAELRPDHSARLYYHPQYFYLGHFSKFIVPGSVRIATAIAGADSPGPSKCNGWPQYGTCSESGLQAIAFSLPDLSTAVVLMNCGDEPIVDVVLTTIGESGKKLGHFTVSMPSHSIATFLVPPATPTPVPSQQSLLSPSPLPTASPTFHQFTPASMPSFAPSTKQSFLDRRSPFSPSLSPSLAPNANIADNLEPLNRDSNSGVHSASLGGLAIAMLAFAAVVIAVVLFLCFKHVFNSTRSKSKFETEFEQFLHRRGLLSKASRGDTENHRSKTEQESQEIQDSHGGISLPPISISDEGPVSEPTKKKVQSPEFV